MHMLKHKLRHTLKHNMHTLKPRHKPKLMLMPTLKLKPMLKLRPMLRHKPTPRRRCKELLRLPQIWHTNRFHLSRAYSPSHILRSRITSMMPITHQITPLKILLSRINRGTQYQPTVNSKIKMTPLKADANF